MSEATPPPNPPDTPPPAESPSASGSESGNRNVMIVLSYIWILALVPLLVEKDDREVQWHAKHGLVLLGAEIILWVILSAITATGIGCVLMFLYPIFMLVFLVIRIMAIVKGLKGERFLIPWLSDFADKF